MKRILLPLSLLLLLALAAGCSAQGEAQLDPTMAQQLQIDEAMAATLAPGIQDVDVTDREDPYVTAARFVLLDYTGEEIAQTLLSSSSSSV